MRNDLLDIVKGLAILLVVLGHTWIVQFGHRVFFSVIYSFHIPLFFFLSGILLKTGYAFFDYFYSRAQSLLKPYLSASIIFYSCYIAYGLLAKHQSPDIFYSQALFGIFYASSKTINPHWIHLWFLPSLFLTTLAAFCIVSISKYLEKERELLIFFITLLFGYLIYFPMRFDRELLWGGEVLPITLFYMLSGYLARSFVLNLKLNKSNLLVLLVSFILLSVFFPSSFDLNGRNFSPPLICLLKSMMGILIMFYIGLIIQTSSFLSKSLAYLGNRSLFIYIFHFSLISLFFPKFVQFLLIGKGVASILVAAFAIASSLLISEIILKHKFLRCLFLEIRK